MQYMININLVSLFRDSEVFLVFQCSICYGNRCTKWLYYSETFSFEFYPLSKEATTIKGKMLAPDTGVKLTVVKYNLNP